MSENTVARDWEGKERNGCKYSLIKDEEWKKKVNSLPFCNFINTFQKDEDEDEENDNGNDGYDDDDNDKVSRSE